MRRTDYLDGRSFEDIPLTNRTCDEENMIDLRKCLYVEAEIEA